MAFSSTAEVTYWAGSDGARLVAHLASSHPRRCNLVLSTPMNSIAPIRNATAIDKPVTVRS